MRRVECRGWLNSNYSHFPPKTLHSTIQLLSLKFQSWPFLPYSPLCFPAPHGPQLPVTPPEHNLETLNMLYFFAQIAPELISGHQKLKKLKKFLGGHAPRPPYRGLVNFTCINQPRGLHKIGYMYTACTGPPLENSCMDPPLPRPWDQFLTLS